MNDETAALLFDVVERLQKNIAAHDCPAIVALEGERKLVLSDYDYLRDPGFAASFETRAAAKAQEIQATRWVIAVPLVWVATPDTVYSRAVSNHPLREGEQETITWMSFNERDGVDYGRVPYARRPSGEPVFDDPEMFAVGVRPAQAMPGHTLLQELLPHL
ncbi:hypothetical protein FH608_047925 [Nonomuraea phyllanthi]|uniref:Uncharacterized protein n=1 Tax=Nonomuraea phyllanthi TaxID=2219224 RepID=A0A5C4V237_9ACTN|nr:hypothetical protein [Nonomuraea phyllanthi]KAB8185221.1 hypothetical protein FH608_047925 [Nonomuraea phyllanthi]QFY13453.1 hypothetical protein GBF35_48970 [Nonomuraea phyllanthi]